MSDKTPRERFEELTLPRKEVPKLAGRYRVYKDTGGYITVEAASALEAFKQSGLPQVRRIERDAIYLNNVMNLGELLANTPVPAAPAAAEAPVAAAPAVPPVADPAATPETKPVAAAPAEEAKPVATPPAADAPLSTADVDKLLKGEGASGS